MSTGASTVRNIGMVGISQIVSLVLNQIVILILAHMLLQTDFGVYSFCIVIINLSIYISILGLDAATIYYQKDSEKAYGTASSTRLILSICIATVVILAAPILAPFFKDANIVDALRISGLAIIISSMGYESTLRLTKSMRFKELSISKIINSVAWSAAALVLAFIGWSYWSLLFAYMIGFIAMACFLWLLYPWKVGIRIDRPVFKDMVGIGMNQMSTGLIMLLVQNLDKFVVGLVLGASILGDYYMAFTYGTLVPMIFNGIVDSVLFATYSKMQGNSQEMRSNYLTSIRLLGYVSIPLGVGLLAIATPFVIIVIGPIYSGAIYSLAVFALVGIITSLTTPAAAIFLGTGKTKYMLRQTIITYGLFFLLLVPVTVYFGIFGVSILYLLVSIIGLFWVFFMISRILKFSMKEEFSFLASPFAAAIIMAAVCFEVGNMIGTNLLALVVEIGVGAVVYVGLMTLFTRGKALKEGISILRLLIKK